MKKLLFTATLIIISIASIAQIGIYKSAEDYSNNKLLSYDTYGGTYHLLGDFKVYFTKSGEPTQRFDVDNRTMWGYKRPNGDVLRVDARHNPCVIIENGDIVVYGNHESREGFLNMSLYTITFVPQISLGPNGKMRLLTKTSMINIMGTTEKTRKEIYALEPTYEALIQYIIDYNDRETEI